jgi:ASPIC/UnbV protein
LAGTRSNRMAIGARVKIVAGGMTQTDEVRSGGSYISQSDFRLHFGLGSAEKIESLEVRWPSGKVETFKNLAADRWKGKGSFQQSGFGRFLPYRAASKPDAAGTFDVARPANS